jgi:hypothetical protein
MKVCFSALAAAAGGCALVDRGWFAQKDDEPGGSQQTRLKPIASAPAAMLIEILFVERPTDDPLVGNGLWREIDEVGAVDPKVKDVLTKNGFRVGVSSSSPPRALQTLLGMAMEIPDANTPDDARKLVGRRVAVASGSQTQVQTSQVIESCAIVAVGGEKPKSGTWENARCVFQLKVQRVQEGWAKLEFTPEIHYGEQKLRQTAHEAGWQLENSQRIVPFHTQRFELTLIQGDMAIIAPTGEDPKSLGRHFFLSEGEAGALQRMLIVRLADIGKAEVVSAR